MLDRASRDDLRSHNFLLAPPAMHQPPYRLLGHSHRANLAGKQREERIMELWKGDQDYYAISIEEWERRYKEN